MKNAVITAVLTAVATALAVAAVLWVHDRNRKREEVALAASASGLAYVSQGLQLLSIAKTHLSQHWDETGEIAESNAAAGLEAPEHYAGDAVRSLTVGKGGVITVVFNEKSGVDGGILRFTPDAGKPDLGLQFHCTTPTYRDLERWLPQCAYVADRP